MEPVPTVSSFWRDGAVVAAERGPYVEVNELPFVSSDVGRVGYALPQACKMVDLLSQNDLKDIDLIYLENVHYSKLIYLCGLAVELCNKKVVSRLVPSIMVCVVDHPVYIFIPEAKKVDFVEAIGQLSSHQFLSASFTPGRFLATPQGRRLCTNTFMDALGMAGVMYVSVETYAMKSPIDDVHDFIAVAAEGSNILLDFGGVINCHEMSCVPLLSYNGRDTLPGRKKTRPMFFDFCHSSNLGPRGTFEWTPNSFIFHELKVLKVKLYPTFTHWLKAKFPVSLFNVPSSVFGLKQRLAQLSAVNADLRTVNDDDIARMSTVRVELTVGFVKEQFIASYFANHILPDLMIQIFEDVEVQPIPLHHIAASCRSMLDNAILNNLGTGRDKTKVTGPKKKYICHLLNEIGIATDSVVDNLGQKFPSGRYHFDRYFAVPASSNALPRVQLPCYDDEEECLEGQNVLQVNCCCCH
jgi:hypothetical protein